MQPLVDGCAERNPSLSGGHNHRHGPVDTDSDTDPDPEGKTAVDVNLPLYFPRPLGEVSERSETPGGSG